MSSPVRRAPPTNTTRRLPHQTQTRTRAHGSGTATPEGSATQTVTSAPPVPEGLTLRLRGQHEAGSHEGRISTGTSTRRRRQIQWAEDVIDNEGLGRKRSKVCCIYHKNREVGESSSEDDSSSEDSDGSDSPGDDDGSARPVGGGGRGRKGRRGEKRHEHGDDCGHGHGHGGGGEGDGAKRKPSPNAYEKMPRYDVKPLERQPGK